MRIQQKGFLFTEIMITYKRILDLCLSREREYDKFPSFINLLFRCFGALMMIPYGITKIEDYDKYVNDFFGDPIGLGNVPSLWLTMFAQLICPVTLAIGFQTRISAAILAFNMLVATKYHFFDPFVTKSLPMLFLAMYIVILMWGAGKYSVDHKLYSHKSGSCLSGSEKRGIICVAAAYAILCVVFSNVLSGIMSVIMSSVALGLLILAHTYINRQTAD